MGSQKDAYPFPSASRPFSSDELGFYAAVLEAQEFFTGQ
jgi:hypothetical protein